MKPLWHKLQEGGLGEVVAAEMLQGVADFHRDAVAFVKKDHQEDWRGLPQHADLRWNRAVAVLDIFPNEDDDYKGSYIDNAETRIKFAVGFDEPPRVRGAQRVIDTGTYKGWWLEWKLFQPGPQAVWAGYRLWSTAVPFSDEVFVQDLAAGGADYDEEIRRRDDEGRGRIFLGRYDTFNVEEETAYRLTPHLKNLRTITLIIK